MSDGVLSRSQGSFAWTSDGNFSTICPNGTEWVWVGLGECAQGARDMASVILGLFSIACFMVSSIPQYYSSCRSGNMDSALSIWFLMLWLSGDSCNLVGSFLADQLPLQTYTAVYYVLADLLMLALYLYYATRNRLASDRAAVNAVGVVYLLGASASLVALHDSGLQTDVIPSGFKGRALLAFSEENNAIQAFTIKEIIGFTIGSLSSVLYLCSRLPQMYTNYKRKSTEGVSFFLFALVILGNTTYGLSILLKNPDRGNSERSYIIHHLPWLFGSLGTLSLDLLISLQFLMYRNPLQDSDKDDDETTALLAH